MMAEKGSTLVSLSEEDVSMAIQEWLNTSTFDASEVKVIGISIHRSGAKKALTVEVESKHREGQ